VAKDKGNYDAYRGGALIDWGGHIVIRPCSRTCRLHRVTHGRQQGRQARR